MIRWVDWIKYRNELLKEFIEKKIEIAAFWVTKRDRLRLGAAFKL